MKAAGLYDKDVDYGGALGNAILDVVRMFSLSGHSGMSASITISALEKLLRYEPLGPLTGNDSEWMEVGEGVFQNNRCSRVFKQADRFDGQAYDIDGIVWRDQNGSTYTNSSSRVPIVFPYSPKTEYRDYVEE